MKMTWSGFDSFLRAFALRAAATITFIVTIILALEDKTSTATVMAGLFALTVIFVHFPSIESFKAWGVEAKLIKETLEEAKASLEQFRKLVALSSRQIFWTISTQGRFAESNVSNKNSLAIATIELMKETGVDQNTVDAAQAPYLRMIDIDFLGTLRNAIYAVVVKRMNELSEEVNRLQREKMQGKRSAVEEYEAANRRLETINALASRITDHRLDAAGIQSFLADDTFIEERTSDDGRTLETIRIEIERLMRECHIAGCFTSEAEEFIKTYGPYAATGTQALIMSRSGVF